MGTPEGGTGAVDETYLKEISDPIFEEIEDDLYMETLPWMKNK